MSARERRPDPWRTALVASVPRSGTWYNTYLFAFYDALLRGAPDIVEPSHFLRLTALRLNACFAHATCPGFKIACTGSWRATWDRLRYYTDGFAWADPMLEASPDIFDPGRNPDARIVFLYRNPFDQSLSFYRHARNHQNEALLAPTIDGKTWHLNDPREFMYRVGLEAHLKLYLSYRFMQETYPENILMVSYEGMMRDPPGSFRAMLEFLGLAPDSTPSRRAFAKALRLADRRHLRRAEQLLGHSLAADQREPGESHIGDGTVGAWRRTFVPADVDHVAEVLSRFGLALDEFDLD
jgi:hypothetical protein